MPCLLAPDLSSIPHTGSLNFALPPLRAPVLCLRCEQAAVGLTQAGRRRAPHSLQLSTLQLSLHSLPTIWQSAAPTPIPVWSSRHSLSFQRNSDFPGVWSRLGKEGGGWFGQPQFQLLLPAGALSSHSSQQGTATATTEAWQIGAEGVGWPIVGSYFSAP